MLFVLSLRKKFDVWLWYRLSFDNVMGWSPGTITLYFEYVDFPRGNRDHFKLALGFGRMAWSFCFKVSNKHPLLWFCSLISVVLVATLLDSHSSSFSILESTFSIGHLCKAQNMVNPSSKRLVSMNTFKFVANYSMVVKIIIVSMWCYN